MPERQVRDFFGTIFGVEKFIVNQQSAFALGFPNLQTLLDRLPTLRKVSVYLASMDIYAGNPTRSLAEIFGVSPSAMAIRLEELSLVEHLT
jgi:hypothetical protein